MSEATVDVQALSELTTHEDGRITFRLFTESPSPLKIGDVRLELMDVSEGDDAALIASLDVRAGEDSDGIEIAIGQTVALPGGGTITLEEARASGSDEAPDRFIAHFTMRAAS